MGKKYNHLTERDRIFLRIMLEKRYSKAKIAKILRFSQATIYREIKRNSVVDFYSKETYYWNYTAHKKYLKRRKRGLKIEKDLNLKNHIHSKLKLGWSPYQIEGRSA